MTHEENHTAEPADGPGAEGAEERVMNLLSEHVPLSLIVDLSRPDGPDSQEILTTEGEPEDAWWGVSGDGSVDAEETAGDGEPA